MWYWFNFESGANPYIAKTEAERDRIIRKYKRKNIAVRSVSSCRREDGFSVKAYTIHDKEGDEA